MPDPESRTSAYRSLVTVDGTPFSREVVDRNDGYCADADARNGDAYEFVVARACRLEDRVAVPVDTTGLAPGTHRLVVQIEDASGNATTVLDDDRSVVAG